jgi:hypothetical protein
MGIYTDEHQCGCVTAQGSWEKINPMWFLRRCGKADCSFKNEYDSRIEQTPISARKSQVQDSVVTLRDPKSPL